MREFKLFDNAPDDATHFGPGSADYAPCWYKQVDGEWYVMNEDTYHSARGHARWKRSTMINKRIHTLVPRPTNKFYIPINGLPEIRSVVEGEISPDVWKEVMVLQHCDGRAVVSLENEDKLFWCTNFRREVDEETLKKMNKEALIQEMVDLVGKKLKLGKAYRHYIIEGCTQLVESGYGKIRID